MWRTRPGSRKMQLWITRKTLKMEAEERQEGRLITPKNFWSVRVANKWTLLPDLVKSAKNANGFWKWLDNWMEKKKRRKVAAYPVVI